MPTIIFPAAFLFRTWPAGAIYQGTPLLFGANDRGLEVVPGLHIHIGQPLTMWSNAV